MTTRSKGSLVSHHSALLRVGSLWRGLHISAWSLHQSEGTLHLCPYCPVVGLIPVPVSGYLCGSRKIFASFPTGSR